MPFGDRTGPLGLGPMTGRAMGYCTGYGMPGSVHPAFGFGRGFWRRGRGFWRRGFGRGLGKRTMLNPRGLLRPRFWRFASVEQTQQYQPHQVWQPIPSQQPTQATQLPKEQELQLLEQELEQTKQEEQELFEEQKALKQEQEQLRKRLEELKQ